jgi:hypothetical protein
LKANLAIGAYDIHVAKGTIPDPVWPPKTMSELLEIAFGGGRLVDKPDHDLIKRLRSWRPD